MTQILFMASQVDPGGSAHLGQWVVLSDSPQQYARKHLMFVSVPCSMRLDQAEPEPANRDVQEREL